MGARYLFRPDNNLMRARLRDLGYALALVLAAALLVLVLVTMRKYEPAAVDLGAVQVQHLAELEAQRAALMQQMSASVRAAYAAGVQAGLEAGQCGRESKS